jgi:hypothetical protein
VNDDESGLPYGSPDTLPDPALVTSSSPSVTSSSVKSARPGRKIATAAITASVAAAGGVLAIQHQGEPAAHQGSPRAVTRQTPTPAGSGLRTPSAATSPRLRAMLATIPVKGRAPRAGYDRDLFGPAWADINHNGCDTRNDVLRRDLTHDVLEAGTDGCIVLSGQLHDPYSGRVVEFQRSNAFDVQIDHVVALADAWDTGAFRWAPRKRLHFANDPLDLLAVIGSENMSKGDSDAASWLPPSKSYRCAYVSIQIRVIYRYRLWITPAEARAMSRLLATC